jgi:hypothetical protein
VTLCFSPKIGIDVSFCGIMAIGHRKTILDFSERAQREDSKKPKIVFVRGSNPEILAIEGHFFSFFFLLALKRHAGAK